MDELAGHPWERVDELLELTKREALEAGTIPESVALIFHDGLSGILLTPAFVTETADEVTDELCRFLPPLRARGLAVVWPAVFEMEGTQWWAMKVHLWDAAVPDRMETQIWPLPIRGTPDGPPRTIDPPDPWSKRLAVALTEPSPLADLGLVDNRFPPGYEFRVAPGGALDGELLHGAN